MPAVRMGLRYVRGLGSRAGARLRAELERGPFRSLEDAVERIGGEAELRALAAAGAFRTWVPEGPRRALWTVLGELRRRRSGGPLAPPAPVPAPPLREPTPAEATVLAHHTTSVDLDGHPMRHLRARLAELDVVPIAGLRDAARRHGERVTTAGVVIVRQRPGTAKGFVFVGLEDETGRLDVIVNPKLYAEARETVNGHGILAVRGRIGKEEGVVNLKAEAFYPLRLEEAERVVPSHDYH